ncbi:hypothetical protein SUSAZ_10265 [Sulfolobus acidocaldarius SUSAZ]|nr:hypothetical protein SUSAZ_10265 [Sulfolobus acidocaldarius SUSAZ]
MVVEKKEVEITTTLPMEGFLSRELAMSSAIYLKQLGLDYEVERDKLKLRAPTKQLMEEVLNSAVNDMKNDEELKSMLRGFTRNYSDIIELLMKITADELINNADSETDGYPLILPETMEAERWFGGWNGKTAKKGYKSIKITLLSAFLATLSFSWFRIIMFKSKIGNSFMSYIVLAPIDSSFSAQLVDFKKLYVKDKLRISGKPDALKRFSHLNRIFSFSFKLWDAQKIIMLTSSRRTEVIENNSYASIRSFIELSKFLRLKYKDEIPYYVKRALSNEKVADFMNRIVNLVFEALGGSISPEEMAIMIWRENLSEDDPPLSIYDVRKLKEGVSYVISQRSIGVESY